MIKVIISFVCVLLFCGTSQAESLNVTLSVTLNKAELVQLPKTAKSIFISSNTIANYQALTNTKIMVFGKQAGTTSLYVLDNAENVIYSATVKVSHNVDELNSLIKNEFPDALVSAESIAGKLFLKGRVPTPTMAEKIVRLSEGYVSQPQSSKGKQQGGKSSGQSKGGKQQGQNGGGQQAQSSSSKKAELINQLEITMSTQVNLRVRIAEVSRNVSNKLGIKWGSQGFGTGKLAFVDGLGWSNLSVMVDALSTNGMISVLAEPNLTAISGEKASFLVGGEVPIPLIYGDTASIEYKPFGVRLDFKPTVLSPNRISLQIEPEVSTLSQSTNIVMGDSSFPIFMTRKASTTIELASGQSFALGGLLQSNDIEQMQKMPWIGDIPILGALFRSNEFKREETELIIIATAYLVDPTRGDSLPLPTDGLIPLSDVERLLAWPHRGVNALPDQHINPNDNRQLRLLGDNGFYY
ncbi:Flp pilus assembly protein, secretin CpaC [Shewanella psychrophila]|uniref:Flp pilus assembly protein, secretin CpaC n=1 Tax=Shewanella psychrophila TaxID=225848 RepID=A0A1S6HPJ4_9GAMM|nr:type II and III secretion system protein family protein [Shewanella psychrophila]AQS37441.1 Flp pilus assembly protein, secretin CpaC [Shewanella psychrophila]